MTQILIIALLLLSTSAFAWTPERWDGIEITEGLAFTGLTAVDFGQTRWIAKHPDQCIEQELGDCWSWHGYHEDNLLVGTHPSIGKVNLYFPVTYAMTIIAAEIVPHRWRKTILAIGIGVEVYAVRNNYSAGIKVDF